MRPLCLQRYQKLLVASRSRRLGSPFGYCDRSRSFFAHVQNVNAGSGSGLCMENCHRL